MKYVVTLNGKKYEVEVEKGEATAVYVGAAEAAAPAPVPAAAPTAPSNAAPLFVVNTAAADDANVDVAEVAALAPAPAAAEDPHACGRRGSRCPFPPVPAPRPAASESPACQSCPGRAGKVLLFRPWGSSSA